MSLQMTQFHPSTEEWIKKMWYIYTMEYYSSLAEGSFGETHFGNNDATWCLGTLVFSVVVSNPNLQQFLLAAHFTSGNTDCIRGAMRSVGCHTAGWAPTQDRIRGPCLWEQCTPPTSANQDRSCHQTGRLSPGWTASPCSCSISLLNLREEDRLWGWL